MSLLWPVWWQPIESADLADPNAVLLYWPFWSERPTIGYPVNGGWWTENWLGDDATDPGPTHWMPLPGPPRGPR